MMKIYMKLICKILCAMIAALLTWEIILQCTVGNYPKPVIHPVLGRIPARGICIWGAEGYAITSFNSLGMRNAEITAKGEDEFRVLALGDSFTEALQVSDKETFCAILQQNSFEKKVNVINAGRSAESPAYYIYLADYYDQEIRPDYVVVQLNEGDFTGDIYNKASSFYINEETGSFAITDNKPVVINKIDIVPRKYISRGFLREIYGLGVAKIREIYVLGVAKNKINAIFTPKASTATTQTNPRDYGAVIEWITQQLKNKYQNVVIVYLPTIRYDKPDSPASGIEKALAASTQKYNVDFINMRHRFIQEYMATKQPVHGFHNTEPGTGHINQAGHRLVAAELTEYFKERVRNK